MLDPWEIFYVMKKFLGALSDKMNKWHNAGKHILKGEFFKNDYIKGTLPDSVKAFPRDALALNLIVANH
ncbi:hypothetical protein GTU79_15430 [Sodalis ligni]|uniref:hypothetical protein n=1 Tax=Sodalis ligni TaxID=2697027 RepID=UPI001BDEA745|nr:hypothetical protein [Sodalis ligni]QWA14137.1 hypothetical protein GTU79_15430 [Sodalis ligni]